MQLRLQLYIFQNFVIVIIFLLLYIVSVYSALKVHMVRALHVLHGYSSVRIAYVDNRSIESSKLLEVAQMHNEALRVV